MSAPDNAPGPTRPGAVLRLRQWWGPRPLAQAFVCVAVFLLFVFLAQNATETMGRAGISFGFDFLSRSAQFEIAESTVRFSAGDTYLRAISVGLVNTILIAVFGCIFATIVGVGCGIALLSGNLLLAGLTRCYVEIVRNTPLLLQLFFWVTLAKVFPPPRNALSAFDIVFLSNRGVFFPGLAVENLATAIGLLGVITGIGIWIGAAARARGRRLRGRQTGLLVIGLAAIFAFTAAATGVRASLDLPALGAFNIRGGFSMTPEFAALLVGLTVKFSTMIAEIVRAGILSVSRGQWEAARAVGLHDGQILRLVVLPQALRVVVPPTTSVYLDLAKDSSLAVAIGYPDLVNIINTTANTTGQSLEALAILVAIFLILNLSVSAAMNIYNARVALRGSARR